ncbi:MAG: bifunctional chorismate mutase/prephenate dehydratase [Oscillospiraceae bacterium]
MADLQELRVRIDEIDKELARLFAERMATATEVADEKIRTNMPVLDATREAQVIERGLGRLNNAELAPYYRDFLQHLMGLSRQYQTARMGKDVVACQGVEGGFGYHVAQQLFSHARLTPLPTFEDVFKSVEEGQAAVGIVPFENSTTGEVAGVLDLCYSHNLFITGTYDLPVTQCLLGVPGATLADIKTVTSHVQALEQSKRFLDSLQVQRKPAANTALAAQLVAEAGDKQVAAIASTEAAELYGLVPLVTDIATEADNTTRFIVISKTPKQEGERFALLASVENTVGSLAQIIQTITSGGFNMENIKSRPMPHRPWEYYFYIELAGQMDAQRTTALLEKIQKVCLAVKPLGVFTRMHEED